MTECKWRDRLMFAITNMNTDMEGFEEALENFRKYGKPISNIIGGANETQVAGDHYKGKAIQPWDYIAANGLDYFSGNIVKYVSRFREKRGVEDLRKARHYLDKLIELESEHGNQT